MLRFGIYSGDGSIENQETMTFREIGEYLGGVSHERARQIQNEALEKMKRRHSTFGSSF